MVKKKKSADKIDLSGIQLKKWVINLSKRQLSQPETPALAKGPNFVVAPDRIPVDMFILQSERACNMLKKEAIDEKQQLKADVRGVLKSTKSPKSNITKEERAALNDLGKDKSILILPTDKGRVTFVMDKEEYEVKDLLADERTYETLRKDPTPEYKDKLVKILDILLEEQKITSYQHYKLARAHMIPDENAPYKYCTLKIHKQGNPPPLDC